jgi:hypothetical protein
MISGVCKDEVAIVIKVAKINKTSKYVEDRLFHGRTSVDEAEMLGKCRFSGTSAKRISMSV